MINAPGTGGCLKIALLILYVFIVLRIGTIPDIFTLISASELLGPSPIDGRKINKTPQVWTLPGEGKVSEKQLRLTK